MAEHSYFECKCGKPYCRFCGGGLGYCTVCNGFEGTLTTHCPGRKLTEEEEIMIYNLGILDFRNGRWVYRSNYSRYYRK